MYVFEHTMMDSCHLPGQLPRQPRRQKATPLTGFDPTNSPDVPDDVVRSVAAEISGGGLKPLSDQEKLDREIWREQQLRQRALADEQRAFEREQRQAELEATARHEAAEALALANRQARERMRQEYLTRQEQRTNAALSSLQFEAQQSAAWRNTVQNAVAYQQLSTNSSGQLTSFIANYSQVGTDNSDHDTQFGVIMGPFNSTTFFEFSFNVSPLATCTNYLGPSQTCDGQTIPINTTIISLVPTTTTPLPAALPLFATGLAGLGLLGWRRKRKAQAV